MSAFPVGLNRDFGEKYEICLDFFFRKRLKI